MNGLNPKIGGQAGLCGTKSLKKAGGTAGHPGFLSNLAVQGG
jgi:hypothetical protein